MIKRVVRLAAGVLLIGLGVVGLFLPILQGWLLIFAGLSILSPDLARRVRRKIFGLKLEKDKIYFKSWEKYSVRAGFTTRHLDLFLKNTAELLLLPNQRKFKENFAGTDCVIFLNQVHADRVEVVESISPDTAGGFSYLSETDGVITNLPWTLLVAMTADCLPIYFCTVRKPVWVGLVHAGWRGTKAGIAKKAFELFLERSGAAPSEIRILFGPSIGAHHYEVGPEFQTYFPKSTRQKNKRFFFDLVQENRRQLVQAGALGDTIQDLQICTSCEKDLYSYRHDKDKAGRQISFIHIF